MNFTLIKALCYIPETVTCKLYLNLKTEFSNMPQNIPNYYMDSVANKILNKIFKNV